ncbi:MAG: fimbrillin family protein [Alistipes sp.]|nr:fimbrillin family protein [Alistipes sp.]
MKTIRRLLLLALPLSLLASCSKDGPDEIPGGGTGTGAGEPITFDIGFDPMTRVATDAEFKSTWEEGDEIGIFAFYSTPPSPGANPIHNAKLTYIGGQWTGDIYWPADSETAGPLYFFAYYPYDDNGGIPGTVNLQAIDFSVASDQREQADHNCSDLLMAPTMSHSKGETVSLTLRHSLSMVELTLDNGNRVIDPAQDLNVTLKSVYSKGTFGYNGNFTTDQTAEPEDVLMHRLEKPGTDEYNTDYTFRAFIPRQTLEAGERKFVIDNGDIVLQSSALSADISLAAGQAEQFIQTLPLSATRAMKEANSYMVEPNSAAILIPVSQANRILDGESLGALTTGLNRVEKDNFTVELVWADSPVEPGGVVEAAEPVEIDGEGYIRVVPGRAGNAVIGIKLTGDTDYRWSWHIWVTDPVTPATDTETGLTWMDRNLGATANNPYINGSFNNDQWVKTLGLYYQWGRKDAFPGGDGTNNNQTYYTPTATTGTTANPPTGSYTELPGMVQNPLNYATNWQNYSGSVNQPGEQNDSWGGNTGIKTVYDPCPSGWRIPPITVNGKNSWGSSGDWDSWTDNGRVFHGVNGTAGVSNFYPASGYRLTSGQLYHQGTGGYYWSTTASSATNGYNLTFNSSSVTPAYSTTRTAGFSVRCVAE